MHIEYGLSETFRSKRNTELSSTKRTGKSENVIHTLSETMALEMEMETESITSSEMETDAASAAADAASTATIAITGPRTDYIYWDQYFMELAILSARRSKDPSTQVGACLVTPDKKVAGVGYNGFPTGISDTDLPWGKGSYDPLETKYPFVCHAEMNAITNANSSSLKGCTLYVTLFPCNECAKLIIQRGITKVYYLENKYAETWSVKAAEMMFDLVGITYERALSPAPPMVDI